jgi:outer membrane scaffolding protein for murein synthesis (MipA/OmpV family)
MGSELLGRIVRHSAGRRDHARGNLMGARATRRDATLPRMPMPAAPPRRATVLATLLAGAPAVAPAQVAAPAEAALDAPQRPRWEIGLAAGGGRVADYPGADQSHTRGIVAPVLLYRGPVLRVDQGGIRGRLVDSPDWELDLSLSAAFNARDNDARQGMPGLDYLFGAGPQLVYKGARHRFGGPTLHLKARAVMSTDFRRVDRRGATFDAELRWRLRPLAGSLGWLTLSVQPTWASRSLQRYFYQVDAGQATAMRPAHDARAGYLGTELGATWSRRHSDSLTWFVAARALSLHGAVNRGSPLLRERTNLSVGAGLVWTPWQSSERVAD